MDKEERQKLIEQRRKEQEEKELQNDLHRDLKMESLKNDIKAINDENNNKLLTGVIIFLGTLLPLYLFVFGSFFLFNVFFATMLGMLGIHLNWLPPFLHAAIWVASIFSVYREQSVLDILVERVF